MSMQIVTSSLPSNHLNVQRCILDLNLIMPNFEKNLQQKIFFWQVHHEQDHHLLFEEPIGPFHTYHQTGIFKQPSRCLLSFFFFLFAN